jgi:RNA polymerase sigma factor (sigma-70 family)
MIPTAWEPATSSDADRESDEELVGCFQAGDDSAFDELVKRHHQPLWKYLAGLVGDDYALDLTQDIFIVAYQKLPGMQEVLSFKAWIYRVATNSAKDHWRRGKLIRWLPWVEHKEFSSDGHNFVAGPERRAEEKELISKVMNGVSPKYRPCLYLDIFEDMKQQEIADLLGISKRTVRRYIFLGKEQLREAYEYFTSKDGNIN